DVTWGKQTKRFSAADLGKGINLAAEFLDGNPFAEAFAQREQLIAQQQVFETPAVKTLLHSLPEWQRALPDEQPTIDRLTAAVVKKDEALRQASRAAVVPVKHTIKVQAAK